MISIVTINFNAANVTLRLIRSLSLQSDSDFKLYVIDNDSEGSDRKTLRKAISDCPIAIELIESDINGGFSAGNNLGIRRAMDNGAQWIVLLNNDAVVSRDFVKCLREQLPSDPGIVGLPIQERERI
ncbi:MAG: glycosyltransferase, partial [Candidatus Pacebacteria bacterium]|nr:glycosyltransferase [Candidatus Paceibacterota bacterium]